MKWALLVASFLTPAALAAEPGTRGSVSVGLAVRSAQANDGILPAGYSGLSFLQLRAAGAVFPVSFLGGAADFSGDWFSAVGKGFDGAEVKLPVSAYRVRGAVAGRWAPKSWLGLELQLGYWYVTTPTLTASNGVIAASAVSSHAPVGSVVVNLGGGAPVSGQVYAHLAPFAVGASSPVGRPSRVLNLVVGAQVGFVNLTLGPIRGALLVDYEFSRTNANGAGFWTYVQNAHRIGLGLRLEAAPPPAQAEAEAVPTGPGVLYGHVVTGEALQPLADAAVTVAGLALRTDASGRFRAPGVGPGAVKVHVEVAGYRPADREVTVPPGASVQASIALEKPTGPGTIRGVVTVADPAGPAVGLEVSVPGAEAVKTGDDGAFALAGAGPGPVEVTVKGEGYEPLTEAVRVPPEAEVSVSLSVHKRGVKKPPGTLRGQIRSVTGKPVRATVTITETKYRAKVGADGRFSVSVPGGRYTLVVEAPGHVTQTLSVDIADGDHAIFHCDLEPVRK